MPTDDTSADTLNERELATLAAYRGPGSGAEAAQQGGYTGNRATLKSRAAKILAKPAAKRWLADRAAAEAAAPPRPRRAEQYDDDHEDADEPTALTPKEILQAIAKDKNALPSSRVRAAELLRREELASTAANVDPFAELRVTMNEIIRAKRAREREEETR